MTEIIIKFADPVKQEPQELNRTLPVLELDMTIPLHDQAFLAAAGHFLASNPRGPSGDWSGERLLCAILSDEDDTPDAYEDSKHIIVCNLWQDYIEKTSNDHPLMLATLIENLALDFVNFPNIPDYQ